VALTAALLAVDSMARLAEGSAPPGWRALAAAALLGVVLSVLAHHRASTSVVGRAVGFAAVVASARVVLCVVRFTAGCSGSAMYGLMAVAVLLGGSFGVLLGGGPAAVTHAPSPAALEGSLWSAAVALIVGGASSVWPLAHTQFVALPVLSAALGLWALAGSLGLEQRRWAWLEQVRRGAQPGWRIGRGADSGPFEAPSFFARETEPFELAGSDVLLRAVDGGGSPYRAGRAELVVARLPPAVGRAVHRRRRSGAALAAAAVMVAVVAGTTEGMVAEGETDFDLGDVRGGAPTAEFDF
jgi:hypothetical protein